MGAVQSAAIRPLYHMGERSLLLRGSRARRPVLRALEWLSRSSAEEARRTFAQATPEHEYLDPSLLDALIDRYRRTPTRADRRLPKEKAALRAQEVLRSTLRWAGDQPRYLELACGDGRVAAAIAREDIHVTATDLEPQRLSSEALEAGVHCLAMDAQNLTLEPNSFDVVYCFDAFEHFDHPEAVLMQIERVLRPGGVVYGSFGPLYFSPHGAHQWFSVDVPYCHLLFAEEDLNRSALQHGKIPLVGNLNRWHIADYRAMFRRSSQHFEQLSYFEKFNVSFAELICAFPGIFRGRTGDFDDLIVRSIEFVLRKRG